MSAKDCESHRKEKLHRRLFGALLAFIIAVLFVILVVWLVLRPQKPQFSIQDATVIQFNATSSSTISSRLQVTIYSYNPNDKTGISYDRLQVYSEYHNQQITLATDILPLYQGHKDINIFSPFIYGDSIPVSPYLPIAISQDENVGILFFHIKLNGKLCWKVGTWISGHYHLDATCPAYFTFFASNAIRIQHPSGCHVEV